MAGAAAARLRAEIRRRERELRGLRERLAAELARGDAAEREEDGERERDEAACGARQPSAAEPARGDAGHAEDEDGARGMRERLAAELARGDSGDADEEDEDDDEDEEEGSLGFPAELPPLPARSALSAAEILRYSRQLVLPELGVRGQLRLARSSVLVVGCGGLGCPLAQYLAAAGVGRLGLVDHDVVETSNLQRQVLHGEARRGRPKARSAAAALRRLNSAVQYVPYRGALRPRSALRLVRQYDIVADCSDNAPTRYLALEVLKIASGMGSSLSGSMLTFDALEGRFRNIKLRPRRADCAVCGDSPSITCLQDYEAFCGSCATDKCRALQLLPAADRLSVQQYKALLDARAPHVLLDVRPPAEADICRLPHALHIPLRSLQDREPHALRRLHERVREERQRTDGQTPLPVYVVCKLGNDSQKAVKILQELPAEEFGSVVAKDIKGGLMAWATKIDSTFPQY
ncbi:adenylyltransferase and sulfurtransferase MOCS3 isoform X2 [Ammospiza nelsoni]|uniref:adenylyltransferase and sulfurtransferase MOCS3 isoform X2 n=1 Tax=Ammospiza nelsoni TaxID=2857394 RepID=UPI002869C841|nr:adenylyltransferase and sulfurtransferase MOCS3 isoform X2 [Ammospiza nelsoni]